MTDNGPQFSSDEFHKFSSGWGFEHVTSSPHYPQSNGKAENAVKTVKRLFSKCAKSGQSEFRALLDWRNTPTEGMNSRPAQRFLGCRCKTLLPTASLLLKPRYATEEDTAALTQLKERQKFYYNRHVKSLPPLNSGETIRMRLPGKKTWTPGTCVGQDGPRSYRVKVGEQEYRRNWCQLRQTKEPPEPVLADTQSTHDTSSNAEPDSVTQESTTTREEQVISQDTSSELESPTPVRQRRSSSI